MKSKPFIREYTRTSLVASTVNYARARGLDLEFIAAESGLRLEQLVDPEGQVADEVLPRIWKLLATSNTGMSPALHMASASSLSQLVGSWIGLAAYAGTLRSALRAQVESSSIIADRLEMDFSETMSFGRLEFTHPLDVIDSGYSSELGAGVLYRVIKEYSQGGSVERVNFAHSPLATIESYEEYFQAPVQFCQKRSGFVIRREVLDAPMKQVDGILFRYVKNDIELQSTRWDVSEHSHFMTRVHRAVQANADEGVFDANKLASQMDMSLRSLQRHLRDAGVTAAQLIEDECQIRARHLLSHTNRSVKEIARSLGYSDDRAFRRAFQRWTGQSPAAYRQVRNPKQ